jgi:uncharacterized protein (TIGR02611 family)
VDTAADSAADVPRTEENDMTTAGRYFRKAAVLVMGTVVLIVGLALLVLPGPGVLVVAAGLGLLATEFPVAATVLHRGRTTARRCWGRVSAARARRRARR